jgi:hypothetical protein
VTGEGDRFIEKREALRAQARAGLAHRAVGPAGLAQQRDYYRKMEQDPLTPRKDRPLWKQLADELTTRLGDGVDHSDEQSGLF